MARLYRTVRSEVYDRYPDGLPRMEHLEPFQRERLEELGSAEEALDALRRRWDPPA